MLDKKLRHRIDNFFVYIVRNENYFLRNYGRGQDLRNSFLHDADDEYDLLDRNLHQFHLGNYLFLLLTF